MFKTITIGILLIFLLASCTKVEYLSSDEVLKRSAIANQNMKSVNFDLLATYNVEIQGLLKITGKSNFNGTIQQGGEQTHFVLDSSAKILQSEQVMDVNFQGEVITGNSIDTMFRIYNIETNPIYPLFTPERVEALKGVWWRTNEDKSKSSKQMMLTPDSKLIKAQSEVVKVIADLGFDTLDNNRMYHYKTKVDPDKLNEYLSAISINEGEKIDENKIKLFLEKIDAKGEIWIDAQTFQMKKIKWTISPFKLSDDITASISFTMTFSKYNKAEPIQIPENTIPLTQEYLLMQKNNKQTNILPSLLPTDAENAIINKLLSNPSL